MKRAIVLSGGGAKGAYQIGVWKALNELNIDYSIVTGTSVGALNGAFFAMKDYESAYDVWQNISYSDIYGEEFEQKMLDKDFMKDQIKKAIVNHGMEISALENLFASKFDYNKITNSGVDFGIVTFCLSTLKPVYKRTKDLSKDNFGDYVLASASIFPFFKTKKILNRNYIDGGYCDQIPIDLALKMGAEEIIAIDLKAPGILRPVENKKNIKIISISPNNELNSILKFEKRWANKAIEYGYNDTLKKLCKMEGNKYTFELNTMDNLYNKYEINIRKVYKKINSDNSLLQVILKDNNIIRIVYDEDFRNYFNSNFEKMLYSLKIDDSKRYNCDKIEKIVIKAFNEEKSKLLKTLYKSIKNKKNLKNLSNLYRDDMFQAVIIYAMIKEKGEV